MSVFVKTTNNGSLWSYCYGADALRVGQAICVTAPFVPLSNSGAHTVFPLYSGSRHSWPVTEGWIYGYEHKSARFQHPGRILRFPKWIPERLRTKELSDAARYVIRSTAVGGIFRRPDVLRAVSEEIHLDSIEAILRTPIFLPSDEQFLKDWSAQRPDAFRFALEDADRIASQSPSNAAVRRHLRLEAHRKIDAEREQFTTTPCIGGEAYVEFGGGAGSMKFGRVKVASYPKGEKAEKITAAARNEETLLNIENAILPGALSIEEKLKYLPFQRVFHAFEETSPLPSVGYEFWGEELAPRGFSRRSGLTEAASSYSAMGIACVVSDPAKALLADKEIAAITSEEAAIFCLSKAWLVRRQENN